MKLRKQTKHTANAGRGATFTTASTEAIKPTHTSAISAWFPLPHHSTVGAYQNRREPSPRTCCKERGGGVVDEGDEEGGGEGVGFGVGVAVCVETPEADGYDGEQERPLALELMEAFGPEGVEGG